MIGLKVTDKTQNATGYWGEIDTTTTFCEPHYSLSPYFAEFVNAWSSLIYVVVGIYIIRKFSNDRWNCMAGLWLVAIGLGSFLFHATMRYSMQLMDELPMVGFVWTTVMHKTLSTQQPFIKKYATYIQVFITLQAVILVIVYTYVGEYELFLHGFTFMVLNDGFFAYLLRWVGPYLSLKQKIHIYGACFIIFGKLVWEIENQLCLTMPDIWPMHTIWHFSSAASAYSTCIFNNLSCLPDDDDGAEIPALFGWKSTVAAERKKGKQS